MHWITLQLETQVSGGLKASPFLVSTDARNLFSHITSHFIFSDHSSHWLFQLQVLTYVNIAPVWVTTKWGRWTYWPLTQSWYRKKYTNKNFLTTKKKGDRILFYKGYTQLFKVQAFFFSLITYWQKESRGPTKKSLIHCLISVHTPSLLTEQCRWPSGKPNVFDHIKNSIIVHEQGKNGGCSIISTFSISPVFTAIRLIIQYHMSSFFVSIV